MPDPTFAVSLTCPELLHIRDRLRPRIKLLRKQEPTVPYGERRDAVAADWLDLQAVHNSIEQYAVGQPIDKVLTYRWTRDTIARITAALRYDDVCKKLRAIAAGAVEREPERVVDADDLKAVALAAKEMDEQEALA